MLTVADKAMISRIVACYRSADLTQVIAGRNWYPTVKKIAEHIHPSYIAGAGVIAALSPRVKWDENIKAAVTVCQVALSGSEIPPDVIGMCRNRDKAWKIARGEYKYSPLELLNSSNGAYKVNAFFANIIGDTQLVTVDVWAARVAIPEFDEESVRHNRYLMVQDAYQKAAKRIGDITPRDLQAVCWVNVRGSAE